MIKKENIWWAEHSARTRQSHVSGKHIPTHIPKHTHIQTFIHACTHKPACPQTCKQAQKNLPHTHKYMHVTFFVLALTHSRVQLERKKKERVGCDWRVRCSDKTNLHTQRLRSEYAWENKTICLQADHPLSLDYCAHLRAFFLLVGVQSSWFSVHWLMVSYYRLDLRNVNLSRKKTLSSKQKEHQKKKV